jgi:raffinose/stachyose/melibiose transport system permease protein
MQKRKVQASSSLKHLILLIAVFVIFFPLVVLIFNAFKNKKEMGQTTVFEPPGNFFNFDNFRLVLERADLGMAFWNTGVIIALSVLGNVILGTMVAYVLGRFKFKLSKAVMGAYLFSTIVPVITTQVATFTVVHQLGLYNTIWAPIALYLGADVLQIFVYLQFVKNIPEELDESAMIEGASLFRIYRTIIFPLLTPATVTLIIIKTIRIYNDMITPYLYMPASHLSVVSTSLMRFSGERSTEWELMSAAIMMIMVPIILLYLIFQKYVFAGIVSGAVK